MARKVSPRLWKKVDSLWANLRAIFEECLVPISASSHIALVCQEERLAQSIFFVASLSNLLLCLKNRMEFHRPWQQNYVRGDVQVQARRLLPPDA